MSLSFVIVKHLHDVSLVAVNLQKCVTWLHLHNDHTLLLKGCVSPSNKLWWNEYILLNQAQHYFLIFIYNLLDEKINTPKQCNDFQFNS